MSRRRGAASVEFALCLPVFVLVVAAIADLSSLVTLMQLLSRAARDGARIGSTVIEGDGATGDDIEEAATEQAELLLAEAGRPCIDGCAVTSEWVEIDDVMYVRVRIEYPYEPLVGVGHFLTDEVSAEFVMMTQQQ